MNLSNPDILAGYLFALARSYPDHAEALTAAAEALRATTGPATGQGAATATTGPATGQGAATATTGPDTGRPVDGDGSSSGKTAAGTCPRCGAGMSWWWNANKGIYWRGCATYQRTRCNGKAG